MVYLRGFLISTLTRPTAANHQREVQPDLIGVSASQESGSAWSTDSCCSNVLSKSHSILCQAINVRGPKEKNPTSDKSVLHRNSCHTAPPSSVENIIKFTKICLPTTQLGKVLCFIYIFEIYISLGSLEMSFPWVYVFLLIMKKKRREKKTRYLRYNLYQNPTQHREKESVHNTTSKTIIG